MAVLNGIEATNIVKMVDVIKDNPSAAQATFKASTMWEGGFHNEMEIRDFTIGGTKLKHVAHSRL